MGFAKAGTVDANGVRFGATGGKPTLLIQRNRFVIAVSNGQRDQSKAASARRWDSGANKKGIRNYAWDSRV